MLMPKERRPRAVWKGPCDHTRMSDSRGVRRRVGTLRYPKGVQLKLRGRKKE